MKKTPFHDIHAGLGARIVEFAGYAMPVLYKDITTEHHAVRRAAGLFDLSHMGRVYFRGPDALKLATAVQTQDAAPMKTGRVRYALLGMWDGGILDDILIARENDGYLLVVNASNRERDVAWFRERAVGLDVVVDDATDRLAMLAIQGPKAVDIMASLGFPGAKDVGYYRFARLPHPGGDVDVWRTGYTGEDGFELIFDASRATAMWDAAVAAGTPHGMIPCGLGCRDTLRLEAGMPLYGHEIDRGTNPYEAGLEFGVSATTPSIAAPALKAIRDHGVRRKLVGLEVSGPRVPREGCGVYADGVLVGEVRSGTKSPTLGKNIATAMLLADVAAGDAALTVDIRGHRAPATRTSIPFYRRPDRS